MQAQNLDWHTNLIEGYRDGRFVQANVEVISRERFRRHQTCSTFFVVRATCTKFGLHAGNLKLNTQKEEW
jgi:hypothetical protein